MKRVKLIAIACFTAALGVWTLNVTAQDFNTNERTYLTFSNAVELPGVTLQAGTYLFRLADSPSNRHIIQILSQDEKQIHATILAVPAERLEVTGENVVTFHEAAQGGTPAVQYWYYPGDRIGHEFVYPKDQAMRIAQRTGQNVLTADGEVASSESAVSSVGPDGASIEWKHEGTAPHTHPSQTPQSGAVTGSTGVSDMTQPQPAEDPERETPPAEPTAPEVAAPVTPAPNVPAAAAEDPEDPQAVGTTGRQQPMATGADELPRTASPLPLSGLIGLLSLGGALAVRRMRG